MPQKVKIFAREKKEKKKDFGDFPACGLKKDD